MPRKNNPKKEQKSHVATKFDNNFNNKCYGCAFAGRDFVCATSDGVCLKSVSAISSSAQLNKENPKTKGAIKQKKL